MEEKIITEEITTETNEENLKPAISIQKLFKSYGKKEVLKGLSLEVYPGELFGFIGRNGIGKSTTIDCMIGIKRFQKGKILVNGYDIIKEPLQDVVKQYALNAKKAGLQGVVCSPLEAPIIKELGLISVTPGIRFASDDVNDQKRVATPAYAKELGSNYIVVGRSITAATDPVAAYQKCVKEFC